MNCCFVASAIGFLVASLSAQDAAPVPPKRSLAEGLVRQKIEVDKLQPPRLESGLEMGAGVGAMVLLIRRADGTLELLEIERGRGDHGPAAKKADFAAEIELDKGGTVPAEKPAPDVVATKLRIQRKDDKVTLRSAPGSELFTADTIDRALLRPEMSKAYAATRGSKVAGRLMLEVEPDALMQDVLTTVEIAREAGFTLVVFVSQKPAPPSPEQRRLIAGIAAKYDWPTEPLGPMRICDGELLILLDGAACWRDFEPIYRECAQAGIWQLSFVGQKDARTRFKLPVNLPFDRGM